MVTAPPLPLDDHRAQIVALLREHRRLVVVAPPGSGKTTRLPPALLDSGLFPGKLVMLQPRRIAARAVAQRIADERGTPIGQTVGYRVRGDRAISTATRLEVVTEGLLLRQLQHDPLLEGVDVVILDEFHERSLQVDLALALLKEVQESVRPDLMLVVMSATLDPAPVKSYLGGDCPVISIEASPHPLEVSYAPRPSKKPLHLRVAAALPRAMEQDPRRGDALVFLPGIGEIRRAREALVPWSERRGISLLELHGGLPLAEQQRALNPGDGRRAILTTNVAETSLTVAGVSLVLDSGLARLLRSDPNNGTDRLQTEAISKQSAQQRAGRAGRLGPGRVHRLWTEQQQVSRPEATPAEVRRVDLASTVLELRAWGADPLGFNFFEAPPEGALLAADALLKDLGALDDKKRLTELGKTMLRLPLHPRHARIVIAGRELGIEALACGAVALLSERDIFSPAFDAAGELPNADCDVRTRLEFLDARPTPSFIQPHVARRIRAVRNELCQMQRLGRDRTAPLAPATDGEAEALSRALLAGYPDRVIRRRKSGIGGQMVSGRGVDLRMSGVRQPKLCLGLWVSDGARDGLVRIAGRVEQSWLDLRRESECRFDLRRERVVASERLLYRDLLVDEQVVRPDPLAAAEQLASAAESDLWHALQPNEASRQLMARMRFLRRVMPELDIADPESTLRLLLPHLAAGCLSFAELRKKDLSELLLAALPGRQRPALAKYAPPTLTVPSGRSVALHYGEDGQQAPVLAVKLQEMFGQAESPTVAGGRSPVLLHLLAPNQRPVQVTQDLASFWNRTYSEVRKDLRSRYPKHPWPEDPWQANPTRRTKGRNKGR